MEIAGVIDTSAPSSSLFIELLLDGVVVRSCNRSSYFDFRDLSPSVFALRSWSTLSDRTHIHSPAELSSIGASGFGASRRLFLSVPLPVRERAALEELALAEAGPGAFSALLLAVGVALFFFRTQAARLVSVAMGKKTEEERPTGPGDKASFLEGTIARKRK